MSSNGSRNLSMADTVTEIKHNLNKPDQSFPCNLLYHGSSRMVISYRSSREYCQGDIRIPTGTLTQAYYEEGLQYILWKMVGPDGGLVGHYVHLCDQVRIGPDRVEYDDQVLDLWFFPDGDCRVLDEEELRQACDDGLIDRLTADRIRTSAGDVKRRIHTITADFDALLGTLGPAWSAG